MAADLTIEVQALNCRRGGRLVLRDLSFSAKAGDFIVVTGANGVGKSTLLRALAGLIPIESGMVRIDPLCHLISHSDALKPALTALENLTFAGRLLGGSVTDPITALARFDLHSLASFPARHLSAGQKRRLALARLLIVRRAVWLLDEPLTGLDSINAARLETLIYEHRREGGIVVAATHQDFAISGLINLALA